MRAAWKAISQKLGKDGIFLKMFWSKPLDPIFFHCGFVSNQMLSSSIEMDYILYKSCSVASLTSVARMTRYVTATISVKKLGTTSLTLS